MTINEIEQQLRSKGKVTCTLVQFEDHVASHLVDIAEKLANKGELELSWKALAEVSRLSEALRSRLLLY